MTVLLPGMTEDDQRVKISSSDPTQQGLLDCWKTKVGNGWAGDSVRHAACGCVFISFIRSVIWKSIRPSNMARTILIMLLLSHCICLSSLRRCMFVLHILNFAYWFCYYYHRWHVRHYFDMKSFVVLCDVRCADVGRHVGQHTAQCVACVCKDRV